MDLAPKVRASYFVNVRGQGEMPTTSRSTSVAGLMSQGSTIAGMTAVNSRPFEEIKRMRLSQALDSGAGVVGSGGGGSGGPQQQDAFGMLRLNPSPTYSTSGRAPHLDTARIAQRFSPGKGVNVSGFPSSSVSGRPAAFGGAGGVVFGPLSPALTEPPTPPSHWKLQEPEAFATIAGAADVGGQAQAAQLTATEPSSSQQGVLPMEQRPIDEVSAVQALMSVGLGKGKGATSLMSVDEETAACPEGSPAASAAIAAVGAVPQQAGARGGSSATITPADVGAFKVCRAFRK